MIDDMPKMWKEDSVNYDPLTGEVFEEPQSAGTDIAPIEEEQLPIQTPEEQQAIVDAANLSEENKSLFGSLIEMNKMAITLEQIHSTETMERRKSVLLTICESFINARFRNNMAAENLKKALLDKLLNNIENLDLATVAQIYNDLHDVTSTDIQQAISAVMGNGSMPGAPGANGINLTINNATSEGATINTATLNAQPQQVQQLKEISTLNGTLRAWQNIPGKKPMQAQIVDANKQQ